MAPHRGHGDRRVAATLSGQASPPVLAKAGVLETKGKGRACSTREHSAGLELSVRVTRGKRLTEQPFRAPVTMFLALQNFIYWSESLPKPLRRFWESRIRSLSTRRWHAFGRDRRGGVGSMLNIDKNDLQH